ncbi:MAG: terpene utilization protein AtuA [Robiginitomaculum sp.]|nr:MAG: terpene utilization protein AtuA [Robiginitomaculum sp.]
MKSSIKIAGASGYWGDAAMSTPQLLRDGDIDYLVYDYLAEVTMSILARARAKDPALGYAVDFVTSAMGRNLARIAKQNVKVISNAGGVNPMACGEALRALIAKQGLDLKVAVISGDDLVSRAVDFQDKNIKEMFSGKNFPDVAKVASINAYLGAAPIAQALNDGADIVITGRCVDSAVTLGACISHFGWTMDEYDKLAQASLAGHIIECGVQATGGNFTDWELVKDSLVNIGYPIVEVQENANFTVSKPKNTGGLVSVATVSEQMIYEIGDPQTYILPDVVCDFSDVKIEQISEDCVSVRGAIGRPPPKDYKVCATYIDGFRAGMLISFTGLDAAKKAKTYGKASLERAENLLKRVKFPPFAQTSIEVIGADSQYGGSDNPEIREVVLKLAVRHESMNGAGILIKETTGMALATPAGLSIFNAGRPKPSPIVRLFSFTLPKDNVVVKIDSVDTTYTQNADICVAPTPHAPPKSPPTSEALISVPLIALAWGRSGDKGDKANIGIIARDVKYLPWIWRALTEESVSQYFAHFNPSRVERFFLPGVAAINFLLHDVLDGGGMASLRNDPQAKAYAQILLSYKVEIPQGLIPELTNEVRS